MPEYLYYHRQECTGLDVAVDDDRWFVHFDVFRHLNESIASQYIRELTDCLQMAKVQAHQWALGRIGQESREEYLARALADLHTTGDDARTCRQLRERIGQEAAEQYQKLFVNKSERNQNT